MNIIGRITRNAEVFTTAQGKKVVNFSVAVNDTYKNKQGERVENTAFFDCSYWKTPNVATILTQGLLVELSGRVSARAWTGKDGEPKAGLNFHTSEIKPLGGSKKSETPKGNTESSKENKGKDEENDDLPF